MVSLTNYSQLETESARSSIKLSKVASLRFGSSGFWRFQIRHQFTRFSWGRLIHWPSPTPTDSMRLKTKLWLNC